MKLPVAWLNTIQHRKRTIAALAGVGVSLLLVFVQLGFLGATRKNATVFYDYLKFDLLMTSGQFLTLTQSGAMNPFRTIQARSVNGVSSVNEILIGRTEWLNASNEQEKKLFMMGVDPEDPVFIDELAADLSTLKGDLTLLMDQRSMPDIDPWEIGQACTVGDREMQLTGDYSMGIGLLASGSTITSHDTFFKLQGISANDEHHLSAIQLDDPTAVSSVKAAIIKSLPSDVKVWTRDEILEAEKKFYVDVKPIGIMFELGAGVAFVVGAVILYQILSAEISNRLTEFATMKAIGFTSGSVYLIGIQQGLIFAILGFIPALIIAFLLFTTINNISGFHMILSGQLIILVLVLSILMCAIASVLALGKIARADPADLY